MKTLMTLLFMIFILQSCQKEAEISSVSKVNWEKRFLEPNPKDSLIQGTTYLSVYSQIYSQTQNRKHDLTATVSLRNTNKKDTIYISKAEYFDTDGKSIRTYFDKTIYIGPMGTVECTSKPLLRITAAAGPASLFYIYIHVHALSGKRGNGCQLVLAGDALQSVVPSFNNKWLFGPRLMYPPSMGSSSDGDQVFCKHR